VETDRGTFTARFLYLGSGYYDYSHGYRPTWPDEDRFTGRIVHPQDWPADLDYAGKRIAVIGSGATAVTLVPSLAQRAAHVTLVQRTPSYIAARPSTDAVAGWLQRRLPSRIADPLVRWKNILLTIFLYRRARSRPQRMAGWLKEQVRNELPAGYPVERDFSPPYDPWDQRLCLVPDADLFSAMRGGKVSIATGAIERFTPGGLRLVSGEEVAADIIVTATGLNARLLGGIAVEVDRKRINPAEHLVWKGMMLSGVPNLVFSFGYTNASWTLRSDLTARTFCRLLNYMQRKRLKVCVPGAPDHLERRPFTQFSSGYIRRALANLPSQGNRRPWRLEQNYVTDAVALRFGRIDADLDFA
jgi:cation diffusion facilitator CzcD-associated flavoprotein CzcO